MNWKPGVSFPPNISWPFSVRTGNCYVNFLLKQFIFYPKPTYEIWDFNPSSPVQSNWHNFSWAELETRSQFYPQTFDGPSVSQHQTPATVFGWTNVLFRQNNPIKFEISTFWLAGTKLGEFFSGLNWKPGVSFTPNFLWAFQCHKIKLLPQFLVEPMYLLEKTKR